jgi:hypothetical protein
VARDDNVHYKEATDKWQLYLCSVVRDHNVHYKEGWQDSGFTRGVVYLHGGGAVEEHVPHVVHLDD